MHGQHILITAPGQAELRPFSHDPGPLPDDHVEGTTLASAISPGTEIGALFAGHQPERLPSGTGYASVIRVGTAGPASGFAPGDLLFTMSGHTSRVRCAKGNAWRIPAGLDPAAATLARLAGVSWSTLVTTAARPPAQVAVTGLGIVGNLAAQIFAAAGYRVLACDPVAARRELLAGRGIETRERLPLEDPAWAGQLDLVVDCSGHEAAVLDGCRMVRKGGEVALVGVPWIKRTEIPAFDLLHAVFHRYVHLRSGWEWEVPREPTDFAKGSIRTDIAGALAWIADGRLRTAGLYRRADPRDCQAMYSELQGQRCPHLTTVFDWTLLETSR